MDGKVGELSKTEQINSKIGELSEKSIDDVKTKTWFVNEAILYVKEDKTRIQLSNFKLQRTTRAKLETHLWIIKF